MIRITEFKYEPHEHEKEKASNSYLMSLLAIMAGLPLPIINLLATFIFYLGNRKGTYFVRWHCTQALLSQASLLPFNSFGFWWAISILTGSKSPDNQFFAYIITIFVFNLAEFIATIYTAIKIRQGVHVVWWFYGDLANTLCKENKEAGII